MSQIPTTEALDHLGVADGALRAELLKVLGESVFVGLDAQLRWAVSRNTGDCHSKQRDLCATVRRWTGADYHRIFPLMSGLLAAMNASPDRARAPMVQFLDELGFLEEPLRAAVRKSMEELGVQVVPVGLAQRLIEGVEREGTPWACYKVLTEVLGLDRQDAVVSERVAKLLNHTLAPRHFKGVRTTSSL